MESVEIGSDTTTYDWDDAGRLLTTTVGSNVTRVYTYSQDGDLIQATVDGLTTDFLYDGDGRRLQMSVAGEVTTYTLDYAAGSGVLFEAGGAFADTKHYLYGLACLGEHVDADDAQNSEWRYYQRDGNNLVRQTTNEQAEVTLAWTFSPEGAVILGEEGPVTHLGCDGNATYDWSTGLIFKNGNYFDPNTGIWLVGGGFIIWGSWQQINTGRRARNKRKRRLFLFLLFILILLTMVGCGQEDTGTPTPTACPTPFPWTSTPGWPIFTPTWPPTIPAIPTLASTPGAPDTPTPPPTNPPPTETPSLPPPMPPTVDPSGTPFRDPITMKAVRPSLIASFSEHGFDEGPGIDLVPDSKRKGGRDATGFIVVALRAGYATNNYLEGGVGPNMVEVKPNPDNTEYAIMYSHIEPSPAVRGRTGAYVTQGQVLGEVMYICDDNYAAVRSGDDHLHLGYRVPPGGNYSDPSFLITQWGPEGLEGNPTPPC